MRMNRNTDAISINREDIEKVKTLCYEYLGSVVNINGEVKEEVNKYHSILKTRQHLEIMEYLEIDED